MERMIKINICFRRAAILTPNSKKRGSIGLLYTVCVGLTGSSSPGIITKFLLTNRVSVSDRLMGNTLSFLCRDWLDSGYLPPIANSISCVLFSFLLRNPGVSLFPLSRIYNSSPSEPLSDFRTGHKESELKPRHQTSTHPHLLTLQ